jgi:hypothetical protein
MSIGIGDKFKTGSGLWEVIGPKPGGKVRIVRPGEGAFHGQLHQECQDVGTRVLP